MSDFVSVRVFTKSPSDAETFIKNYALDATNRLSELDACESFMFAPGPNPKTGRRSVVNLMLKGDANAFLDHEREHWEALVEDGVATDVKIRGPIDEATMKARLGERGTALKFRLNQLSVEMAKLAYDEFEDFGTVPGAVETFPDENCNSETPIGWWAILHHLTVQLNYSLEEELGAFSYGIEHTLRNIAEFDGEKSAVSRIDELIAELESKRADIRDGRL